MNGDALVVFLYHLFGAVFFLVASIFLLGQLIG